MDLDSAKRNRYENQARGASPCPSLQAPSFCDSSPDAPHGTTSIAPASISVDRTHYGHSIPVSSLPEYTYNGAPSSSPASSQASSDYAPPAHDITSPEPSNSHGSDLQVDSIAIAPKRKSNKRADSSPSGDGKSKPSWSYAALIGQAVYSTDTHKISLADIYSFIMTAFPYYRKEDSGWQNSIRHNLSLNECFIKTARGPDNPGKGCLWAVAAGCEDQFADGGFFKRGGAGASSRRPKSKKTDSLAKLKKASASPSSSRANSPAPLSATKIIAIPSQRVSPIPDPAPPTPPIPVYHTMPIPTVPRSYARPLSASSDHSQGSQLEMEPPAILPMMNPIPVVTKVEESKRLAPAYELRPLPPPSSNQSIFNHNAPASPPTSVYNRLSQPYEPSSYSLSSRALALLASPEPAGIMPVHPSIYDNSNSLQNTTPPLSIFPSSSRQRQRTTEFSISTATLSNTHSPISSLRSNSDEKVYSTDPEKRLSYLSPKRSRSHIPSVAALAFESISTPPRLLRSPTNSIGGGHGRNRSFGNLGGLFGTPGGRGRWSDPFGGDGGIEELADFSGKNWSLGGW